uniref:KN motif and ankyrin repeat domains 1b n=1 Tax=Sinocyclocheilus rhinocerous TaxID=307959 RepID=A0A673JEA9_9TELE
MTQETQFHLNRQGKNQQLCIWSVLKYHQNDWSEISADNYQSSPFSIDTPYGYQLDLDFVKYVDDIERSDTIRRLHFNKRPGVANAASEPQRIVNPTHWTSSESLSSVSSDEAKKTSPSSSSFSSSINRRRPPLPHSKPKSSSKRPEVPQDLVTSQRDVHGMATQATQNPTPNKSNPLVEKTLMETCKRLEHEKGPPEPQPRRRLASFGGIGSSGTVSIHRLESQASPSSSGRASPVSGVSPLHLQMVRDQMAAALRRLKDMEEQVKAIPVLQVKISVLQEEKRQLTALVKSQDEAQKSSSSIDKNLQELYSKPAMEGWEHSAISCLTDFQQLSVEMLLLERKIQDARVESSAFKMRDRKSVAVGDDRSIDEVVVIHQDKLNFCKDVAVDAKLETQSVAVSITETMLGVVSDKEAETMLQQQTIQHLSDRVQILEAELKEAMLKAEMGRLRSELREAEARNRADKSSSAHPQVNCTATQTGSQTRTLGVGNHTNLVHSAVGGGLERISIGVGVSCKPEVKV